MSWNENVRVCKNVSVLHACMRAGVFVFPTANTHSHSHKKGMKMFCRPLILPKDNQANIHMQITFQHDAHDANHCQTRHAICHAKQSNCKQGCKQPARNSIINF